MLIKGNNNSMSSVVTGGGASAPAGGCVVVVNGGGGGGDSATYTISCYEVGEGVDVVIPTDSYIYPAVYNWDESAWKPDTSADAITSAPAGAILAPSSGHVAFLYDQVSNLDSAMNYPGDGGPFIMPPANVCALDAR